MHLNKDAAKTFAGKCCCALIKSLEREEDYYHQQKETLSSCSHYQWTYTAGRNHRANISQE